MYCTKVSAVIVAAIVAIVSGDGESKSYENYKLVRITGAETILANVVATLKTLDNEMPYEMMRGSMDLIIAPRLMETLQALLVRERLEYQIIHDNVSRIIESEKRDLTRRGKFTWTAYYDIDEIYGFLYDTNRRNMNDTEIIIGGRSYEGRNITGLRINTGGAAGKPAVVIESGIHAREWITPATITYFINQLMSNDEPKIKWLRDTFDWHIFPSVNPDGYTYSFNKDRYWRKTRSKSGNEKDAACIGADANRNWDYNWMMAGTSSDPCDYQTYGGAKAFSEMETKTFSSYVAEVENLLAYIGFHSNAQMLLVPFSDSVEHEGNYDDLITIGKVSLDYGHEENKAKYKGPATAAEILYKVSGGSMDWVRHALGTPLVYTYELRGFYFHWPPSKIYQQGDEVTQMMLGLFTEASNLGYFR